MSTVGIILLLGAKGLVLGLGIIGILALGAAFIAAHRG